MDNHVAKYLKDKKERVSDLYTWDFDISIPQNKFGIAVVGDTWLERTVSLKDQLRTYLEENPDSQEEVAEYFITEWGGIRRFSRSKEVVRDFSKFQGTTKRPLNLKPRFASEKMGQVFRFALSNN